MVESLQIRFSFLCGLRGYGEYCFIWTPTLLEVLEVRQELGNCCDQYAIACTKKLPSRLTESAVPKKCHNLLTTSYSMEQEPLQRLYIPNIKDRLQCKVA